MKINWVEKLLVNSPVRAVAQTRFEIPKLLSMTPLPRNAQILEIGCGRGVGLAELRNHPNVVSVAGCDLDHSMIKKAQKRVGYDVHLWVGSGTSLAAPNTFYDAVFIFGVLHHIQNWQEALKEIRRVLKPGGIVYLIEYYRPLVTHPIVKHVLEHPQKNRFDHHELKAELESIGMRVMKDHHFHNCYGMTTAKKEA